MDRIQNRKLQNVSRPTVNSAKPASKNHRVVSALLDWFSLNARDLPWRNSRDPYAIWISEIMLQQTQVKTVIPYWQRWMRELPTVQQLAQAPPEKYLKLWEGLGYYTRARNLQKAAQQICDDHDGKFPDNYDTILALPGIGRYTAGAICSIAYNQPTPILDGNVMRVLTRVFGIEGNPRDKGPNARLWQLAEQLVGQASRRAHPEACSHFNQSVMELGALVCTPRQPKCPTCPLQKNCVALREKKIDALPDLTKRAQTTKRNFVAFVVEKRGRFLVQQRPWHVVNARLWEFPNHEIGDGKQTALLPGMPKRAPLCTIKHSITRYRITLAVYRATPALWKGSGGQWLRLADMQALAFSSAHRQILELIAGLAAKPRKD